MPTREQIMTALYQRLAASGPFSKTGRRNRDPETVAQTETPALMLIEEGELYETKTASQPPVRTLYVLAIVYYDVGTDENAIPASIINPLLDGIDAALAPDTPSINRCTLGGLVQSVRIDGKVKKALGDVTGKGLAIVPIAILIP